MIIPNLLKLTCLFAFVLFTNINYSQWERQETNFNSLIRSLFFLDTLNGWATTDSSFYLHTTDGGDNWKKEYVSEQASAAVRGIHFVSEKIGYACSVHGLLFSTADGGNTWVKSEDTFEINFVDLFFVNEYDGWAVGERYGTNSGKGMIVHTSDGGITWYKQLVKETTNLYQIEFFKSVKMLDNQRGWAISGDYFDNFSKTNVYYTEDGGENWNKLPNKIPWPALRLKIANGDTLWADGFGFAPMSISTDGGGSWESNVNEIKYISAVSPLTGNTGWYSEYDIYENNFKLLYTTDRGMSWENELELTETILDIVNKGNYLWICGSNGLIMRRKITITSVQYRHNDVPVVFEIFQNYPNPFNSQTIIPYYLSEEIEIEIKIYDPIGRIIRIFNSEHQNKGMNKLVWDGKNSNNKTVASGVYICTISSRLYADSFSQRYVKMILTK